MDTPHPPHVHLYSANSEVQKHWRHGLAGRFRLQIHEHWTGEAMDEGVGLVDLQLPQLPSVNQPEHWARPCPPQMVACSSLPRDDEGLAALRLGFRGYCNTWVSIDLLPRLVQSVEQGELWIGRSLLSRLLLAVAVQPQHPTTPAALNGSWRIALTEREQEVAGLVADGASNKEVARQLGVAERTVKDHLSHIFGKLHMHDRVQLALHVHGVEPDKS